MPVESSAAVESAKLQALYNFAYGLSHEINNPLANIATRAQTLLADERDPERRRKLTTIVQQAFRAHEMIADLMLFAHPPAMRLETVELAALAKGVVAEMQEQASEQGTALVFGCEPGSFNLNADPTQLAVALRALIQNSLEANASGGSIYVALAMSTEYPVPSTFVDRAEPPSTPSGQPPTPRSELSIPRVLLSVTDTGPGIPPEVRPHIFDPFYSGREAGRGLGLGLCKAWRIAELHGGKIEVESQPGQGAKFTVLLPISA